MTVLSVLVSLVAVFCLVLLGMTLVHKVAFKLNRRFGALVLLLTLVGYGIGSFSFVMLPATVEAKAIVKAKPALGCCYLDEWYIQCVDDVTENDCFFILGGYDWLQDTTCACQKLVNTH